MAKAIGVESVCCIECISNIILQDNPGDEGSVAVFILMLSHTAKKYLKATLSTRPGIPIQRSSSRRKRGKRRSTVQIKEDLEKMRGKISELKNQ
jgi:hypothetical protein